MKALLFCVAALFFVVSIDAQPRGISNGNIADPSGSSSTPPAIPGKDTLAEKMRPVKIPLIEEGIIIDGKPDEHSWKSAAVFKDFYQTSPGNNTAASKPTEVLMMYDPLNLYIAFKCWDERDKIRATVATRDNVFGEDNVRVWLDTFYDRRRAYVLGFNPLGIQQDGIVTEGQCVDFSVDIVMESKGVIEDWGWSVEVRIPFKSLRYASGKGRNWGFNAARNIDRFNDEFDQWLPDDRDVSGFLIKHGQVTGLDQIRYERTLEVVPSTTVSESGRRVRTIPQSQLTGDSIDPGRFVNEPVGQDLGITLKYTLSPSVTLDAAINPDFAEIEADAPVVTANQRFPIFFTEKRPFFLEGQEIFSSPLRIFHSRTIVDPDVALKLSGKVGRNSFGFLAASDNAPGNFSEEERNDPGIRPRVDEFIDKNAFFAVARVKRDFGKENEIGFFGTYRTFPEQKNFVGGIDARVKLSSSLVGRFQLVGTHSRRCFFDPEFEPTLAPEQAQRNQEICGGGSFGGITVLGSPFNKYRSGNGVAYTANLDYTTDTHGWFFEATGRSSDYRADVGFTRRTNTNSAFFFHRNSSKSKEEEKLIRLSWGKFTGFDYDWAGRIQGFNAGSNLQFALQGNIFFSFEAGTSFEKLYEEEFGLKRSLTRPFGTFVGGPTRSEWQPSFSFNGSQTISKKLRYGGFFAYTKNAFDFDFGGGPLINPGPGSLIDAAIFTELRPVDPLNMSISYRKSRITRNDNKARAFDLDIVSLRTTYQFTRFVFSRLRLDYDSLSRNYNGQLVLGWTPSPGTAVFVGYNDDLNRNGFNPFTGQPEPGFVRNGRTFFIRISYLIRKSV